MKCNNNSSLDMQVSYLCQNEYNYFLNKKGVVGVALGYKITRGFSTCKKCISVFVKKKLPCSNLSNENLIPKYYKGIITDVIESGTFKFNSLTSKIRPSINGYSIGNEYLNFSGTSGCLVFDKYLYILSCNHVLVKNNSGPKESAILQPGTDDGGTTRKDVIGHLSRFIPVRFKIGSVKPVNLVDCALCKVVSRSFVSPNIAFFGIPKGTDKAFLNEQIQKVGRTSELTYGTITNLNATIEIESDTQKILLFKNQIVTTPMSDDGDSGSLLLNNNIYALGLLMGGSSQKTIYNPIDEILDSLKVQLVTS